MKSFTVTFKPNRNEVVLRISKRVLLRSVLPTTEQNTALLCTYIHLSAERGGGHFEQFL
jgi:hypothetical protein